MKYRHLSTVLTISSLLLLLTACGGGGGTTPPVVTTYSVSASVSGLTGGTLVLMVDGTNVDVTSDGNVSLATGLADGASYAVSVGTPAAMQNCVISNGSGTINGADVTNVQVACTAVATYSVSGSVTGLAADTSLVLQTNGGPGITVTSDGDVDLEPVLAEGASYNVIVQTQPALQECVVSNGSGTISGANVTNVLVTCRELMVTVNISAPGDEALAPLDGVKNLTVTFADTSADQLTWEVLPAGIAANASITLLSSTDTTAEFGFTASELDTYTVRVTSQDDTAVTADIDLRVHKVFTEMDGFIQHSTHLDADGIVRSTVDGAPTEPALDIAQGAYWAAAVMMDGTVQSWGFVTGPVPAGLTQVKAVESGYAFGIAIKEDNTLAVLGGEKRA